MLCRLNNGYKDEQYDIEVQHIGGERKMVPVTAITEQYITVTWGMSGAYDIYIQDTPRFRAGFLYARSAAARRKGPCLWKAADLEELRGFINERYHADQKRIAEERDRKHHATMPLRKAGQY